MTTKFIGSAEAAAMLGKSSRTVHRLVESGDLVPAHVAPGGYAGVYLFDVEDVEKLVAERGASKATA